MKSILFLILIIQITIIPNVANANQIYKRSYEIKEYRLSKTDSNLVLKFIIISKVDGEFKYVVDVPNSMTNINKKMLDSAINVNENDYPLIQLKQLERFIKENKHLPDIPNKDEVAENGINVGEMQAKLLQKIEELTLHIIKLNNEIKELRNQKESEKK